MRISIDQAITLYAPTLCQDFDRTHDGLSLFRFCYLHVSKDVHRTDGAIFYYFHLDATRGSADLLYAATVVCSTGTLRSFRSERSFLYDTR
jgi:hypothetical protein